MIAAAFAAGLINAIAGGGTLFTFPVLIWLGLDPKVANATSTVALWPGLFGGLFGYRRELENSSTILLRAPSCFSFFPRYTVVTSARETVS